MAEREELRKDLLGDDQENDQEKVDQGNENTNEIDPGEYIEGEEPDPESYPEPEPARDNRGMEILIRTIAYQTRYGLPENVKERYTDLLIEETIPFLDLIDFQGCSITEAVGLLGEKERMFLGFAYIIYEAIKLKKELKKNIKDEIKKQVQEEMEKREDQENKYKGEDEQ